jgi:uncharacterized protein YndB with AHSA1/START domain
VTKIDARTNATANVAEREVVITRVFDAPRSLVFKAWTDPEHMARWWGPTGFTNTICELDARVGGAWRIVMRSPAGIEYPCGGVYRGIVEPERLVFTNIATDNEGNPVRQARRHDATSVSRSQPAFCANLLSAIT